MASVIAPSCKNGLMTEFIGKITMENMLYQGVALITSKEWRTHTTMNGIQQKKSVVMMMAILRFMRLFCCAIC